MKYHLVRWGAFGDAIFVTPVIKYLKKQGHEVVFSTTQRGYEILKNNPYIDELLMVNDGEVDDVRKYWDEEKEKVGADKYINFSESVEASLLLHPLDPKYMWPKERRVANGDVNVFDRMFEWCGIDPESVNDEDKLPDLHFTDEEIKKVEKFFDAFDGTSFHIEPRKKLMVIWVLSGSGPQKAYPYAMSLMKSLVSKYPDVRILTVGDEYCRLLEMDESIKESEQIINFSGKWSIRETLLATKYAHLVIAPETGVLVASGAYDTPKLGIISSITKNHVTKYFKNDYSLEAEGVNCAPCFRMIYHSFQCPIHPTGATMCMGEGFKVNRVFNQIEKAIEENYGSLRTKKAMLSCV